jgi:hypothetical protein
MRQALLLLVIFFAACEDQFKPVAEDHLIDFSPDVPLASDAGPVDAEAHD